MLSSNSLRHYAFTARQCLRLLTLDPLTSTGRRRFRAASDLFGWRTWEGGLPAIAIGDLVPPQTEALIMHVSARGYNVTPLELALLCQLAQTRKPTAVFEFGTFDGRTTVNLAINSPEAQLTTLDLPQAETTLPDGVRPGERFLAHPAASRIEQLFGNSLSLDYSGLYGRFDFVFIDAGHSYECCASDTANAFKLLKPSGPAAIVWHDYTRYEGVNRAVDEAFGRHRNGGRWHHVSGTTLATFLRDA